MKIRKKLAFFIVLTLTTGILIGGCKKEDADAKDADTESMITEEVTPEGTPESASDANMADVPTEPGQSSDVPEVTFAPNDQVTGEEIVAFEPGEKVIPAENSTEAEKNSIVLEKDGKDYYGLTIDKIELTDKRNPYEEEADQVIAVTFTYENYAVDSMLLIGSSRFHMADEDGLACAAYSLETSETEIMPIAVGESCTATVAFAVPENTTEVTLYYTDFNLGENSEYSFQYSDF